MERIMSQTNTLRIQTNILFLFKKYLWLYKFRSLQTGDNYFYMKYLRLDFDICKGPFDMYIAPISLVLNFVIFRFNPLSPSCNILKLWQSLSEMSWYLMQPFLVSALFTYTFV